MKKKQNLNFEITGSFEGLGDALIKATKVARHLKWTLTFKPQKQYAIWIIQSIVLILAIAEIIWFVVTKL